MARSHEKGFRHLLFGISADMFKELGRDPRWVGGRMRMARTPHAWGGNLAYHPDVDSLVPCGGLTTDGAWSRNKDSFFPPMRSQFGHNLLLQIPSRVAMADIGPV